MHPEDIVTNTTYLTQNGVVLSQLPLTSATLTNDTYTYPTWASAMLTNDTYTYPTPTWEIESTGYQPYRVEYVNGLSPSYEIKSYIPVSDDIRKAVKDLGYGLDELGDLFEKFCLRLIDLDEDIRLDEALHDSEDLDDFLKEFIVNNKKN